MTSSISIIIPTLNEAGNIPALKMLIPQVSEIIVVDGGSNDATVKIATDLGISVLHTDKGRGVQLNIGAGMATSEILLFLHADTVLPPAFSELVIDCLAQEETILGSFSLEIQPASLLLRLICAGANLRSRFLQLPYGDQSLFIRKTDFETIGGFPETPIMEDYTFVKLAKKLGKVRTLPQTVTTSARRWQTIGPIRTTCINQLMILGYKLGVTPEKLASIYRSGSLFRKFGRNKRTHTIN
jgi:rSAM/selenodomain-associated transferase 2